MAEQGRVAPQLLLCRGCRQFVRHDDELCRFCGGDLAALQAEHDAREAEVDRATAALRAALGGYEED
jgi:predicted amidophosphoribosyltransferase